ncbi:MAG: diaminopimelate epimerase [Planctomycetes bacterium]|nr:diaminopimelate epimerase [Planctomycetota bacterium]
MTRVPFVKMEGAGNDYVFVDGIQNVLPLDRAPGLARRWSDRHHGIGGDGLIVVVRGESAPVRMLMWNADGSRGAMCGNGLRCVARLAHAHGHVAARRFDVETDAGPRAVELMDGSDDVRTWMGVVRCAAAITLSLAQREVTIVPGDAGNPHAVVFVDDVERAAVLEIGAALQRHPHFADGVNVEFVQVMAPDRLRQRTFERGSGETLACGTGAAVAVVAARAAGHVRGDRTTVDLRGGTLQVIGTGSSLAIEGPARTVYVGEVELSESFGPGDQHR